MDEAALEVMSWCFHNLARDEYLYYLEPPYLRTGKPSRLVVYLAKKQNAAAFMLYFAEHVTHISQRP